MIILSPGGDDLVEYLQHLLAQDIGKFMLDAGLIEFRQIHGWNSSLLEAEARVAFTVQ